MLYCKKYKAAIKSGIDQKARQVFVLSGVALTIKLFTATGFNTPGPERSCFWFPDDRYRVSPPGIIGVITIFIIGYINSSHLSAYQRNIMLLRSG
jgi:hypothetical protein